MPPLVRQSVVVALCVIVAAACALGVWNSWQIARADYLFHLDTEESVRAAIRVMPDGWNYYMRLAQLDRVHARDLLATSLELNRYDAQAYIELGLRYEAEGNFAKAESSLLTAFEVDHTYLPRWTLANYYLRQDNLPTFWAWARSAASIPAEDVGSLFELCWRVSPDPEKIAAAILNGQPDLLRQYLRFLLAKDQETAAAHFAPRLMAAGDQESDRSLLVSVVDRLVDADDAVEAVKLWHLLMQQHWVVADTTTPNNAQFAREPLPVRFDWALPEYAGLHSWPGSSGLESEFTGRQPEDCTIADQTVALSPGDYLLAYDYRTTGIPPGTGLEWQIVDVKSNTALASSPNLSSNTQEHSELAFSVPSPISLFHLRLRYQRSLGTPRIAGTLVVLSTQIQARAQ